MADTRVVLRVLVHTPDPDGGRQCEGRRLLHPDMVERKAVRKCMGTDLNRGGGVIRTHRRQRQEQAGARDDGGEPPDPLPPIAW